MNLLLQGKNPLEILDLLQTLSSAEYWTIIEYLAAENRIGEALQAFAHWRQMKDYKPPEKYFAKFMRILGAAKRPDISQLLFNEMISMGLQPSLLSYTALIDCYAEAGCLDYAEELVRKMRKDCIIFNAAALNSLMLAYSKLGKLDHMNRLFNNMKRWGCSPDYRTFRWVIVAYAKAGLFRRMELLWREMDNNGWKLDSIMISAIIQSYAANGLVKDMHDSYLRIKEYRLLVNKPTIRAMASAYIRISKFYQVRLLVKDLDLMRKDTGTLLWNLLLLAFAANFQVKNVQRTMLGMEKVGQTCDLTTYNICALCYARMKMFWELHAVLVRMRRAGITPDLVTFGAVVDCYISGRERFQKMFKELDELGLKECCPEVGTDPLVFEAFGKGDFQTSSETLMQANPQPYGRRWTYGLLLSFYLKKRGATRNSQNSAGNQGSRFVAKMFVPY
ncbi:hypothetical protein KP509_04G053500 [Ceratopteris richardii]|nr:hypothetical protein KP509_04G053500 [Ceratopteris richardii]